MCLKISKNTINHVIDMRRCNFNQPINGCIPPSVVHLSFGYHFNQPINGCIPPSVVHLSFGCHFNQPINGCIPPSVVYLTFGHDFNQPINSCIRSSVAHLTFINNKFNQSTNNWISSYVALFSLFSFCLFVGVKYQS
jgi:hypothetical protein